MTSFDITLEGLFNIGTKIIVPLIGISIFSAYQLFLRQKKERQDEICRAIDFVIKQMQDLSLPGRQTKGIEAFKKYLYYLSKQSDTSLLEDHVRTIKSIFSQIELIVEDATKEGTFYYPARKTPFNLHVSIERLCNEVINPLDRCFNSMEGEKLPPIPHDVLINFLGRNNIPLPTLWLEKLEDAKRKKYKREACQFVLFWFVR